MPDKKKRFLIAGSQRWAVDQDYRHLLTPEERAWLDRFNDAHYSGAFTDDVDKKWSVEERRERWRARKTADRDLFTNLTNMRHLDYLPDRPHMTFEAPEIDSSPSPNYLNSPEYKAALKDFRGELRKDLLERASPPDTEALRNASEVLKKITHPGPPKKAKKVKRND